MKQALALGVLFFAFLGSLSAQNECSGASPSLFPVPTLIFTDSNGVQHQAGCWSAALSQLTFPLTPSGGGAVTSVFGRTGAVTAHTGDYSFSQISGNLSTSQVPTGGLTITFLSGAGTYTQPNCASILNCAQNLGSTNFLTVSAAIPPTLIFTSSATGLYHLEIYIFETDVTCSSGDGGVSGQVTWNDGTGSSTLTLTNFELLGFTPNNNVEPGAGNSTPFSIPIVVASGQQVVFQTGYVPCSVGTGTYSVYTTVTQ
jgi:hypothetical protein